MSPQTHPAARSTTTTAPGANLELSTARTAGAEPGPGRLSVREIQHALATARPSPCREPSTTADGHPARRLPPAPRTRRRDQKQAPVGDSTQSGARATPSTGPWLPAHDGPVSLAGIPAPRSSTPPRSPASATTTRQRSAAAASPRDPRQLSGPAADLAAQLRTAPPRLLVLAACGGAGATTVTVLLGAALAPLTGALLLAAVCDDGALRVRADATARDDEDAWTQPDGTPWPPTRYPTCVADVGVAGLAVAEPDFDQPGDAAPEEALRVAAAGRGAVLMDWSRRDPVPGGLWATVTGAVVVAPSSAPGLLAAERLADRLRHDRRADTPMAVLIVAVRRRGERRAPKAARARLQALNLPVAELPFDPALNREPRITWTRLRPRTRGAVHAVLTQLLATTEAGT